MPRVVSVPSLIRPGSAAKASQPEGPLPSASTAPSVWNAEAEAPQRKPGGKIGRVIAASSSRTWESV
ncbi:hypothetical protein GA0115255_103602 [Streptomyces sp. Ncost-T6T-2b]|nr:hypothetical protein GA0115255_103602 [Streptomyces sp. Ncost-T6T-2b]